MESSMAPYFSTVNGVPSVTNGQYALEEKMHFVNSDQKKDPVEISITNPVIETNSEGQDITNASTVRATYKGRKSIVSISDVDLTSIKFVVIIGICSIIGLSLVPIILHFVQIDTESYDLNSSHNIIMVN